MRRPVGFAAALALVLGACTPDNGPTMRPGDDCLRCHGGSASTAQVRGEEGGEGEDDARAWSLAGTVYPSVNSSASAGIEGVDVEVTDAAGFSFVLQSNVVGNFYSAEKVAFPLRVCVGRNGARRCMESLAQNGACNSCHALPPFEEASGRIAAP